MKKQPLVEDWKQANDLFELYLDKPIPASIQAVENDDKISDKVKRLLIHLIQSQTTEDTAIDQADFSFLDALNDKTKDISGETIAEYRLISQIGIGGMSQVYKAERLNTDVQKHVALKILSSRTGILDDSLKTLFNQEQKTLAKLNHANIISFHHGGIATNDFPYLVMEYIEQAEDIASYCKNNKLDTNAIIKLIIPITDAINYAHQQLVVHKDIKPSNIILDSQATPFLVDFGIASISDTQENKTNEQIARIYTPDYASPEQVLLGEITISTDVFSFSALLLELLTGEKPLPKFNLSHYNYVEIKAHVDKLLFQSNLDSDLKNVLKKGLANNAQDRYQSMLELKHDLINWQLSKPVTATQHSSWYLFKKFIKRNPFSSSFVTVLFVAIIFSLLGMFKQMHIAELEAKKSKQVTNFLLESIQASDPDVTKGEEISVKELLMNAKYKIQETSLQDRLLSSVLEQTIGTALTKIGQYQQAQELLKQALKSDPENIEARLSLSQLYLEQNLFAETNTEYKHLSNSSKLLSASQKIQLQQIKSELLSKQGKFEQAIQTIKLTLDKTSAIQDTNQVIKSNIILAKILQEKGNTEQAVKILEKTLSLSQDEFGELSTSTTKILKLLADYLANINPTSFGRILEIYEQVAEIQIKLYGNEHPLLAKTYLLYGFTFKATNDMENTKKYANLARDIAIKNFGMQHILTAHIDLLLSQVAMYENDTEKAIKILQPVLTAYENIYGKNHFETNQIKTTLAVYLLKTKQGKKALALLLPLYDSQKQQLGENHQATFYVVLNIVKAYNLLGQQDKAIELGKVSLQNSKKHLGNEFLLTIVLQLTLAESYVGLNQTKIAIPLLEPLLAYDFIVNNPYFDKAVYLLLTKCFVDTQNIEATNLLIDQASTKYPPSEKNAEFLKKLKEITKT